MKSHTILIKYETAQEGAGSDIATLPALPNGKPDTETALAAVRGILHGSFLTITKLEVGTIHEHQARVRRLSPGDLSELVVESSPYMRDR